MTKKNRINWTVWTALFLLVLLFPVVAQAAGRMQVFGKSYNVEVRSVDVGVFAGDSEFTALQTVRSTGRLENVSDVRFSYDFEEETPEPVGRFLADQRVALVEVDGFQPEIAAITDPDLVSVTVNGAPIASDVVSSFAQNVGWHNVHSGSYGVVFPVYLEKTSREETFVIQVTALLNEEDGLGISREITETAVLSVSFVNEHEYKEERELRILNMEGSHVDAYRAGERIYLDFPGDAYFNYYEWIVEDPQTPTVEITFADENGQPIPGVAWVDQVESEAGEAAAIYLAQEGKLDPETHSAVFQVKQDSRADERREVVFSIETAEAVYRTEPLTIVERQDVAGRVPQGLRFAESLVTLAAGQSYDPVVLDIADDTPIRDGGTGVLHIALDENSDRTVIDLTEDNRVYAARPGIVHLTCTYETGEVLETNVGTITRTVIEGGSMCIVVVPEAEDAEGTTDAEDAEAQNAEDAAGTAGTASSSGEHAWYVACRELNVRKAPGTDATQLRTVGRGAELAVVRVADGWAELQDGGFVKAEFLIWV